MNDPYTTGGQYTTAVEAGCGAGRSSTTYNCSGAMLIFDNPNPFDSGIVFQNGSISANGPGSSYEAIAMPEVYQMQWFSSAATAAVGINGASGGFNIYLAGSAALQLGSGATGLKLNNYGAGILVTNGSGVASALTTITGNYEFSGTLAVGGAAVANVALSATGAGATSGSSAIFAQNSSSIALFNVQDNGAVYFYSIQTGTSAKYACFDSADQLIASSTAC